MLVSFNIKQLQVLPVTTRVSRRQWLKGTAAGLAALSLWRCSQQGNAVAGKPLTAGSTLPAAVNQLPLDVLWAQADVIEQTIGRTAFASRLFDIRDYQARAYLPQAGAAQPDLLQPDLQQPLTAADTDLARHNRAALQACIDACHAAGGGRVLVPAGVWLSGALTLRSNVELHLQAGALLQFYPAVELYLPQVATRWEGMELLGYQPLLYAANAENIGITGQGRIDGGGSTRHWWPWKGAWKHTPWPVDPVVNQQAGRELLLQWIEQDKPLAQRVLTPNYLRPPLIQTLQCRRVLIEGITLTNSPFWLIHPLQSEDVIVRGVTCRSHGPNSDGCDPESCKRVLIEHCEFDTGDDCIALKSGRNRDGRRLNQPVEQVLIQHCVMKAGHGGVVLGSEISGGARQIFARDLVMSSPNLDRGLRIKTNAARGGLIEQVALRDIVIGQVKDAIVINYFYEEGQHGEHLPTVRDVSIHNLQVKQAQRVFELRGFAKSPIGPVRLSKVQVQATALGELQQVAALTTDQVLINGKAWRFGD